MDPKRPSSSLQRVLSQSVPASDAIAAARSRGAAWSPAQIEEQARKLFLVAAVRIAAVTLVLVALFVYAQYMRASIDEVKVWQYALIGATYALSLLCAAALRRRIYLLHLSFAQIILDTSIVSIVVLMTGGIESVFTFAYVFSVLGASIILYRTGAIVAALSSFVLLGLIVSLQIGGLVAILPPVDLFQTAFSFLMYSVGIVLVAVLASALAERARITDIKLAEREVDLERLEGLHAVILRSLPAGLMTIDQSGKIGFANEAARGILRRLGSDLIGSTLDDMVPVMADRWNEHRLKPVPTHVRDRFEGNFRRQDGALVRLGFSFAPLSLAMEEWTGSVVVFQDVTDIVRLKQAVERAERLATIGKLAAGLAHEVRNPLASMCASIDVLEQSLNPPESMQRLMRNVVGEADRLNKLITAFLRFARPREPKIDTVDLSDLVSSVVDVFKNDERLSKVRIDTSLQSGLQVQIDEDLIRQVVWNLAKNAAESLDDEDGLLEIRTHDEQGNPTLVIRDNGSGIEPDRMKRIFDPFYTTKEHGSGLGLAITHSIVEAHGAEILLDSVPGKGTEVNIRFPECLTGDILLPQDTKDVDEAWSDIGSANRDFELISGTIYSR